MYKEAHGKDAAAKPNCQTQKGVGRWACPAARTEFGPGRRFEMIRADWTGLSAFQGPSGGFLSDRPRDQIVLKAFLLGRLRSPSILRAWVSLGRAVDHQWNMVFENVEARGDVCPYHFSISLHMDILKHLPYKIHKSHKPSPKALFSSQS